MENGVGKKKHSPTAKKTETSAQKKHVQAKSSSLKKNNYFSTNSRKLFPQTQRDILGTKKLPKSVTNSLREEEAAKLN